MIKQSVNIQERGRTTMYAYPYLCSATLCVSTTIYRAVVFLIGAHHARSDAGSDPSEAGYGGRECSDRGSSSGRVAQHRAPHNPRGHVEEVGRGREERGGVCERVLCPNVGHSDGRGSERESHLLIWYLG